MLHRKAHQRAKGQATVEFALTVLLFMLLVVGAMEMIVLVYTYNVLADAAKEGVRYAIVHGSRNGFPSGPGSTGDIDGLPAPIGTTGGCAVDGSGCASGYGVVKSYARYSLHDTTNMNVVVTYPDTGNPPANQAPNRVRVVVTYPYQPFFGLGWPSVTISAASEGRIFY